MLPLKAGLQISGADKEKGDKFSQWAPRRLRTRSEKPSRWGLDEAVLLSDRAFARL